MTDQDHNLTNEVDPLKSFDTFEKRKEKGIDFSGLKLVSYIGNNWLIIKELPSGVEYETEYLKFSSVVRHLGFQEKSITLALEKLCASESLIFDFNNKRVLRKKNKEKYSPLGDMIKNATTDYNPETGSTFSEEEKLDFDQWMILKNNKI